MVKPPPRSSEIPAEGDLVAIRSSCEYWLSPDQLSLPGVNSLGDKVSKEGDIDMMFILKRRKMRLMKATKEQITEALASSDAFLVDGDRIKLMNPPPAGPSRSPKARPKARPKQMRPKQVSKYNPETLECLVIHGKANLVRIEPRSMGQLDNDALTRISDDLKEKLKPYFKEEERNALIRCIKLPLPEVRNRPKHFKGTQNTIYFLIKKFKNDYQILPTISVEAGSDRIPLAFVFDQAIARNCFEVLPDKLKKQYFPGPFRECITLGPIEFPTIRKASECFDELLQKAAIGQTLKAGTEAALKELLGHHPNPEKSKDVAQILVLQHPTNQEVNTFTIIKTDGSREDFSYRICLTALTEKLIMEAYESGRIIASPKKATKKRVGPGANAPLIANNDTSSSVNASNGH